MTALEKYLQRYPTQTQAILITLTEEYTPAELQNLDYTQALFDPRLTSFGKPVEILYLFGGLNGFQSAVKGLQELLIL